MDAPGSAAPNLPFNSRLLQDMRLGGAVTKDSELIAVRDAAGKVNLLARGPTGALYDIRRSAQSDTGWTQTELGNDFTVTNLAVGEDGENVVACAAGINEAMPEILVSVRGPNSVWGKWTSLPSRIAIPEGLGVVKLATVQNGESFELFAFLQVGPGAPNSGALSLWRVPWKAAQQSWQQVGSPASIVSASAKLKTGGAGLLAFERSLQDPTTFDLKLFPAAGGASQLVLGRTTATKLTAGLQANGYSGVFLFSRSWTTGDQTLTFIDGSAAVAEGVAIATQGSTGCTSLLAADASGAGLTLFLIDDTRHLFVAQQSHDQSWSALFELGVSFGLITQARNGQGQTELFGFDLTDSLRRFWEEAGGSNQASWHEESVDLPRDTLQTVPSYATRMTLKDAQGNVLALHTAQLYAGGILGATVNGRSVVLGPNPVAVRSDARGTVTVYSATSSISTAKLRLVVGSDADVFITPNAHSRTKLAKATVDEIKGILPTRYQADAAHVHQAIQTTMTAVYDQPTSATSFDDPIDASLMADDFNFRFDVRNGRAVYTPLTAQTAEALIAAHPECAVPESFTSVFEWLGNLVESAIHAVESAFTFIVNKVVDGISVVIHLVIRGVTYVFSGILKLVEVAFLLAVGIFAAVGVGFVALFDYLGWQVGSVAQAVWNTKEVIQIGIERLFPTLDDLIDQGEADVAAFFDELRGTVDVKFQQAIDWFGHKTFDYRAEPSVAATSNVTTPLDVAQSNSVVTNWFFDKLTTPTGNVEFRPSVGQTLLNDALHTLENLTSLATASIKEQFQQFAKYLEALVKNPRDFMALTIREVLMEAKSLIDLALKLIPELAIGVLKIAKDAFRALNEGILAAPIQGTLIAGIYNAINPGPDKTPTVLDLLGMVTALPATVIFLELQGRAPYTEADVAAMAASGLAPADHERTHGLAGDNALGDSKFNVANYVASVLLIPYAALEIGGDVTALPETGAGEVGSSILTKVIAFFGGLGLPLAMLGLARPTFNWDNDKDTWVNITWIAWFGPVAVNLVVWLATGFEEMGPDSAIGIWLYSISGGTLLAIGIATLIFETDRNFLKGWLNIALPLPTFAKPLLLAKETAVPGIVLVALDLVCDMGAVLSGMKLAGKHTTN